MRRRQARITVPSDWQARYAGQARHADLQARYADLLAHQAADHDLLRRIWALAGTWENQARQMIDGSAADWLTELAAELREAFTGPPANSGP